MDRTILEAMRGSDLYYWEANYEDLLLQQGPYSPWSKKRIASELGHLSNRQSGEALCEVLEGRGEEVLLAHMSINNNTALCCLNTVSEVLVENGFAVGSAVHVAVAPRFEPSEELSTERVRERSLVKTSEESTTEPLLSLATPEGGRA